jgi:hypothetical protein
VHLHHKITIRLSLGRISLIDRLGEVILDAFLDRGSLYALTCLKLVSVSLGTRMPNVEPATPPRHTSGIQDGARLN